MKKDKRSYIILGIIFVAFTIIAFCVPFEKNGVFALAYIFGCVAVGLQIYFFKVAFGNGDNAKSKFYGFPVAKIGVVFLVAQLVISLIELVLADILLLWLAAVVNVLVLAVALIGSIAADMVRDAIENLDDKQKTDTTTMRNLQSMAGKIVDMNEVEELKGVLSHLKEELMCSDPVSSEATRQAEEKLRGMLDAISTALEGKEETEVKELCRKFEIELCDRNRVCRMNKG